jgi:2-polyprenyl-3-methyl-5-hydroxy-6-metoxy-1,4-benzoquinol methylase
LNRGYQFNYSDSQPGSFDHKSRQRKAKTMVSVLSEYVEANLGSLTLLNVGGSAGIIDEYLSRYFKHVTGIDIDEKAIQYAKNTFSKENLCLEVGDALDLKYKNEFFDVVICSHVYEHVANADTMMKEIHRILKPNGTVYFAAGNRFMYNEPHYNLPLLSVFPRFLAHIYIRAAGKGSYYHEKHLSYWGLKQLVKNYDISDATTALINEPIKYKTDYMLKPGSKKHKIAVFIARHFIWVVPSYVWILKKRT